MTVKRV